MCHAVSSNQFYKVGTIIVSKWKTRVFNNFNLTNTSNAYKVPSMNLNVLYTLTHIIFIKSI